MAEREVWVLVVDDNDTTDIWETRLAGGQHVAAAGRSFRIFSDVCASASGARARLRPAINQDYLPDLVVIDQDLKGAESGLAVMRWLRDACDLAGCLVPPCVLWTADFEPGLAHAFMLSGGRHAFSRKLPSPEFVGELWKVVDHPSYRWEHRPTDDPLELPPMARTILPYLEAGYGTLETANALKERGVISPKVKDPRDWVVNNRGLVQQTCNAYARARGQVEPFQERGHSVALAEFARDRGHIWVPLKYED